MKIAMISTCALATPPTKYGGTELVVAHLVGGLLALGHEVTVYGTGDSSTAGSLRYLFPKPVWPPNDLAELRHASFAWKDIARSMRGFDLVHLHHAAALPYHVLLDSPSVMTVHHERVPALNDHYRCYPEAAFVAISERQADLAPEIPFAKVIHHGLDPSRYPCGEGGGGYVAFLGRFAAEKAPHLAIDAARMAGVPIRLGGCPHEIDNARAYFKRELKSRLVRSNGVRWEGELAHGPKLSLLGGARALLVPLQWEEPFGLVMIEAMLVGTPVIAYARGSAPEIIEDGLTGYLVHDTYEMAERIKQLESIDRRDCRLRAQERFSHLRMAREYTELYEHLARGALRSTKPGSSPSRLPSRPEDPGVRLD